MLQAWQTHIRTEMRPWDKPGMIIFYPVPCIWRNMPSELASCARMENESVIKDYPAVPAVPGMGFHAREFVRLVLRPNLISL